MRSLPKPLPGRRAAEDFVARHLGDLVCDGVRGADSFSGGQAAADAKLASFDVTGYADRRNEVAPSSRRGASRLSPYIRHGLLSLPEVWAHVAGGPHRDVERFRDELMWQEFARHWYARLGTRTRRGVRHRLPESDHRSGASADDGWPRQMACLDLVLSELEQEGWLVNQTRMWLAGHWTVRQGLRWNDGEDHLFRHLLDGSRAANRLGWQWVTGATSSKVYGFSRNQVERRAPGTCTSCVFRNSCPIEHWPSGPVLEAIERDELVRFDPTPEVTAGPTEVWGDAEPDAVWLTAESLGRRDPALAANPRLPVVFVFDEPLLATLHLSSKRLVFLTETLAELGTEFDVRISLGHPVEVLEGMRVAVTFAPVPGFRRRAERLQIAELHPWPWLRRPTSGPIDSFSAWRRTSLVTGRHSRSA
jgi:deoxyribodipyrimidine photo-lyase